MNHLGQTIKERRETLNITIDEAAKSLRIRKNFIVAIEEDKIDSFASKAYYYGYMKQYLKLLDLDYIHFDTAPTIAEQELAINIPQIDKCNPSVIFVIIALALSILIYNLCENYISKGQPIIEVMHAG